MPATDGLPDGFDAIGRDRIAYTVEEAARLLSMSVRTVRYMVARGELLSVKVGKARRVHGGSLEAYVREHTQGGVV